MKFACPNHQNKAQRLIETLVGHGHEFVPLGSPADLLLIDHDLMDYHRRPIDDYKAQGATVLMYPHGANPNLQWDGFAEPYCEVDAFISPNAGHKRVMEAYQYPKPIHVVGWWLCDVKPFEPTPGRHILFAPIHPAGDNTLPIPETSANQEAFDALHELLVNQQIDSLTVRYLNTLDGNGLDIRDGVTYLAGVYDNSHADILKADCVVTSGTYGYLAAALGKPLVMYFQGLGTLEKEGREPAHYPLYEDLLRYPLDIDIEGLSMHELILMACAKEQTKWRELFVGDSLDEDGIKVIEGLVK